MGMNNYTYINSEPGLWTVGDYDAIGRWQPESDHPSPEEAAARTAWLNGEDSRQPIEIITARNYRANMERKQISKTTDHASFHRKIAEEVDELGNTELVYGDQAAREELADIALVCFAMAQHFGWDLIAEMERKTEINEKRAKEEK